VDWTEKHRPRSLDQLVGNGPAVAKLRQWGDAWRSGIPAKRAVVLAGTPGTGKTSAALALAHDMGWAVIELNASDARNADAIRRVATAGALHQTFDDDGSFHASGEGGRKLIVLDEADNLYERLGGESGGAGKELSDRGGKTQIVETIRRTQQPIVLIVNDLYALTRGSGSALNQLAETIRFAKVNARSIPKALEQIAREEGVRVERQVLEDIAAKAEGDLRAAVRDLESVCLGRTEVTVHDLHSVGARDGSSTVFDVVRHILKGSPVGRLRRESMDLDATPEDLVLWVDENLPKEYKHPEDLVAGYEMLSRADVFLGRTRRTQNYRLWAYAGDLATVGVMAVRRHEYRGFTPFGFPQWLSKMSRSRGVRTTQKAVNEHIGRALHLSRRKAGLHQVDAFRALFAADEEFAVRQTFELGMDDDEVALLSGEKASSKRVKKIREGVQRLEEERVPEARSFAWKEPRKEPHAAEDDGQAGASPGTAGEDEERPRRPEPSKGQASLFGF